MRTRDILNILKNSSATGLVLGLAATGARNLIVDTVRYIGNDANCSVSDNFTSTILAFGLLGTLGIGASTLYFFSADRNSSKDAEQQPILENQSAPRYGA